MVKQLILDGQTLDIRALHSFCTDAAYHPESHLIVVDDNARNRIKTGEDFLQSLLKTGNTIYGLNTGFGFFANTRISAEQITQLQHNIILSHCCGVGDELSRELTLMMWLILLNSVCRGHRGLSLRNLDTIITALNKGMLACVPARGSVGASGDLAPSAHAVAAMLGYGECTIISGGEVVRMDAKDALAQLDLNPVELGPKEGLCLINGTQMTAAMAIQVWNKTKLLVDTANIAAAMSIEALRGSHHMTDDLLLREGRHQGTRLAGEAIASWLGDTEISNSHSDCERVQDPYSLRCAPQVHGMVWEELLQTEPLLQEEINATTDNPTLFPEANAVLHGGNFHAIYPARVCDRLTAALATLASISERRINMAMKNDKSGLPDFLILDGGLNSGYMMIQTTAAALVSECKALSYPASVDSIPTNNDQEDHVSMGPIAGLKALQVADLATQVIGIELMVACQGIDMLSPLKTSEKLEKIKAKVRSKVPYLDKDRMISPDVKEIVKLVESGVLLAA